MAKNPTSEKRPEGGKYSSKKGRVLSDKDVKSAAGGNRTLVLALAGFTAAAMVVLIIFAVVSTTGGQSADNFTANDQGLLAEGATAPDFSGENLNGGGGPVSLDGDQNASLLVFFASWCPHCQNEAPIISELESQYEADGLKTVMIGVDSTQGDNPEAVRGFVENFDIESPAIYQPALAQSYQVTGYPTVYVLDGENRVVGAHSGEMPREVLEGWIEEALG